MQLTTIQYDAIMRAINGEISELRQRGLDPFDERPYPEYTEKNLVEALEEVEDKIIKASIPN